MRVIALGSASKGRPRPSFFLLLTLAGTAALAQQPVFRCGQEYTNAPVDPTQCERLTGQAVTVIPGTRVQAGAGVGTGAAAPDAPSSSPSLARVEAASQKQRDDMARAIVSAELDKARQRHAELQLQYRQAGQPPESAAQVQLKAALDRAQRDIDSLQRELDRRPAGTAQP